MPSRLSAHTYFQAKDRPVENTFDSETGIKGSLTRNFRPRVFFMNHISRGPWIIWSPWSLDHLITWSLDHLIPMNHFSNGPWVSHWGHFECLPKLAEIFATLCKDWINRLPVSEVIILQLCNTFLHWYPEIFPLISYRFSHTLTSTYWARDDCDDFLITHTFTHI